MEEEKIFNRVSFVTLYYSWRYRGGDLWRLRGEGGGVYHLQYYHNEKKSFTLDCSLDKVLLGRTKNKAIIFFVIAISKMVDT